MLFSQHQPTVSVKKYEYMLPDRGLDVSNSAKSFSDTSLVTLNNKCFINRKGIFEDWEPMRKVFPGVL